MKFRLRLFLLLLAVSFSGAFAVIDTISVDVGISVENTMPIGLVPFEQTENFEALVAKPEEVLCDGENRGCSSTLRRIDL